MSLRWISCEQACNHYDARLEKEGGAPQSRDCWVPLCPKELESRAWQKVRCIDGSGGCVVLVSMYGVES